MPEASHESSNKGQRRREEVHMAATGRERKGCEHGPTAKMTASKQTQGQSRGPTKVPNLMAHRRPR